jgi:hypothetical protein
MITLNYDVQLIKKHLRDKNYSEIRQLSEMFTKEYNSKILSRLNPFEVQEWINIHYN